MPSALRREKNRHHLGTALSLLLAIPVLSLLPLLLEEPLVPCLIGCGVVAALLVGRTVMIEVGIRREASEASRRCDRQVRLWLRRHLGIAIESQSPAR